MATKIVKDTSGFLDVMDAGTYEDGAAPLTGDVIICREGNATLYGDATSVDLDGFEREPTYRGALGGEAGVLDLSIASTKKVVIDGPGRAKLAGTLRRVDHLSPAPLDLQSGSGVVYGGGGGQINVWHTFQLDGGANGNSPMAIYEYTGAGTASVATLAAAGALVQCERDVETLQMGGRGRCLMTGDIGVTTILRLYGGLLDWRALGTIAELDAIAGVLDPTRNGQDVEITTASIKPGADVVERWGSRKIVYGSVEYLGGSGGASGLQTL